MTIICLSVIALKGSVREDIRIIMGYVFRQQTIVNSPGSGYLECMVSEGERIKEGQVLGYIYQTPPSPVVLEHIKATTNKLMRLKGIEGESDVYASDPGMVEKG